jgi:hypothetical protein
MLVQAFGSYWVGGYTDTQTAWGSLEPALGKCAKNNNANGVSAAQIRTSAMLLFSGGG